MSHSEETIQQVWEFGRIIKGQDPDALRQDACSAWIFRSQYGNRDSIFGWEIDHIDPNGPDGILNFQPLQWQNNVDKSSGKLKCNIISSSETNIEIKNQ